MKKHIFFSGLTLLVLSLGACSEKPELPMQEVHELPDYAPLEKAIDADIAKRKQNDSIVDGLAAVKIGDQLWTSYNLNVANFQNGDAIPQKQLDGDFAEAIQKGLPAYCYITSDKTNGKRFGKMYNLTAVNDPRGLAPKGWHIPAREEWITLLAYLGNNPDAKLKSTMGWITEDGEPFNGTNESRFSVYPGGLRLGAGLEIRAHEVTGFWSTTPAAGDQQDVIKFFEGMNAVPSATNKNGAYYLRLVHD